MSPIAFIACLILALFHLTQAANMTMDGVAGKYTRAQGKGPRNIQLMRGGAVVQKENMIVNGHRCGLGQLLFSFSTQNPLAKVLQKLTCVEGPMISGTVEQAVICSRRRRLRRNESLTIFIAKRIFTLNWRTVLPVGENGNLTIHEMFRFTAGRKYLVAGNRAVYVERLHPGTEQDAALRMRPRMSPSQATNTSEDKGPAPSPRTTNGSESSTSLPNVRTEGRYNIWNWAGPLVGALATVVAAVITAIAAWKFQFSIPIVMRGSRSEHREIPESELVRYPAPFEYVHRY